jgi:hypothetical protein
MSCKSGDLYRSLDRCRAATELGLAQHIVAFRLLSAIAHPSGDAVAHILPENAPLFGSQRSPAAHLEPRQSPYNDTGILQFG